MVIITMRPPTTAIEVLMSHLFIPEYAATAQPHQNIIRSAMPLEVRRAMIESSMIRKGITTGNVDRKVRKKIATAF